MGPAIVIMGVSGSGKTSVAKMLSESLNCCFLEADDFHPKANREKMSKGIPLSDEDRIPWLESLHDAIRRHLITGRTVAITCSALKRSYREILRSADPNYKTGDCVSCKVKFFCLVAPVERLAERINKRSEVGEHFMPVSLLESQLALLHIDEDEGIPQIDSTLSLQAITNNIVSLLKDTESCKL
ncbi:gluconokinase [Apostasia shenzhenica]|uniref:Gluconokinase n=1 Tax=Apostasia shenzhenica TaxID=1088818 RepID=A0A2I0BF59_9ASPA|nr:gluconokinase [Apostasia shenzhenica]